MCIICIDFDRRAMTLGEARRALGEMVAKVGPQHAEEVRVKLSRAQREAAEAADAAARAAKVAPQTTDGASAAAPVAEAALLGGKP